MDNFHSQKKKSVRESVTKFLSIYIDENLAWKYHIEHVCNKVSISIGIMYKSRNIIRKRFMKQLYFSFIHSYLNYANIAWASTNKSNSKALKTINLPQATLSGKKTGKSD